MNLRSISKSLIPLASIALCTSFACAQQAPPATPAAPIQRQSPANAPMRPGPGMMHPGMMQQGQRGGGPGNFRGSSRMPERGNMRGGFHGGPGGGFHGEEGGGFHIGPEGIWWRSPMLVQRLTLTPDQVKRMDGIFQDSRIQLIDLRANVQKQEVMLEPLLSANPLDTAHAQEQIDKVADARAELEKANAKMLLGIRAVLTPAQWTRLHTRDQGPGSVGRPGGGPGGPGGGSGRARGARPGGGNNFVQPASVQ